MTKHSLTHKILWRGCIGVCLCGLFGVFTSCSTQKNTASTRFWHSFTAQYNTLYNGQVSYAEGVLAQEKGHQDNYTDLLPIFVVANKQTAAMGKSQFDVAITKSQKTIKVHSIKRKPKRPAGKMSDKQKAFYARREFNPRLHKAWMLMADAQFREGEFVEAASTYHYILRMYHDQPEVASVAQAKLARCYVLLDWPYDAEDVLSKMSRDSISRNGERERSATMAALHVQQGQYTDAIPHLLLAIKNAESKLQRARLYYLLGQLYHHTENNRASYKALSKCLRQNPPYALALHARLLQTEVMSEGQGKAMTRRLKRMLKNPNNEQYQDAIYLALGNIFLANGDTAHTIGAWENGIKESKGSNKHSKNRLLLQLGDLYWQRGDYIKATPCYHQLVAAMDKEEENYAMLQRRSVALDHIEPHLSSIHLQDSLQALAQMPEAERLAAIDRVIEELRKQEKEAERREAEGQAGGTTAQAQTTNISTTPTPAGRSSRNGSTQFYFYTPTAVMQGKQDFQRQWGRRPNQDLWRFSNKETLAMFNTEQQAEQTDSLQEEGSDLEDLTDGSEEEEADTLANDPHNREYYLAQIPFTEEQVDVSNSIIADGLYKGGIIAMEELEDFPLAERMMLRLHQLDSAYTDMDNVYYHLFLLALRNNNEDDQQLYLGLLQAEFPDSKITQRVSNPDFMALAVYGRQIEDSLYGATYNAYREGNYWQVESATEISTEMFPEGRNRAKFLFLNAMTQLHNGHQNTFIEQLRDLISKYGNEEITAIAKVIIEGVDAGRTLNPDQWNAGDLWARKNYSASADSAQLAADTLSTEFYEPYLFIIAYPKDSINDNMALFYLAQHNFTTYSARDFDIAVETERGVTQLRVSGFNTFDEVYSYSQHLMADTTVSQYLAGSRIILISEANLRLLGTRFSYDEYKEFYDTHLAPATTDDTFSIDEPTELEYIDPEDQPLDPSGQPNSPNSPGSTDNDQPTTTDEEDDWLL
ncbi:MAG: tetratricopeptide repeat protein [Bacteroidaceae bacterium]|nr:tetratricopeptide repeat protein [Bacteroidaceae bacterium]